MKIGFINNPGEKPKPFDWPGGITYVLEKIDGKWLYISSDKLKYPLPKSVEDSIPANLKNKKWGFIEE